MRRTPTNKPVTDAFGVVTKIGPLPDVEAAIRYDGSPVLKLGGAFMAGLAMHDSAGTDTLVVRASLDQRECLLEDAPDTYYLTDYYRLPDRAGASLPNRFGGAARSVDDVLASDAAQVTPPQQGRTLSQSVFVA